MSEQIRVVIAGPRGRMGLEAVKMVLNDPALELVGGIISPGGSPEGEESFPLYSSAEEAFIRLQPDVLVDLTTPKAVRGHMEQAILHGIRPVVGTTGLTPEDIEEFSRQCVERKLGGIIAPNFAIGAVLMMKFASVAARYMPNVEIIEMHHDQKLDAPSGTAVKTAELIREVRPELHQGHPNEKETIEGARGGYFNGFRIHSVRLPGLVAHQEVLFGHTGQLLSIRHDSMNRESFMPGINLSIKKVMELDHLVYGLENVID